MTHAANCPYDGKSWACTCGADRLQNAEADLKAEWANLSAATDRIKDLENGLRTIGGWALASSNMEIFRKVKSLLSGDSVPHSGESEHG